MITCSGSSWSKCFRQQPVPTPPECSWLWLYASSEIFGSARTHLDQMQPGFFKNRIDRRLTRSPGISGAFNALPICDSQVGHLSNGLWGSHGDMKPLRRFILGLKSHLYPWRTYLRWLILYGAPFNYIWQFQSPHGHLMLRSDVSVGHNNGHITFGNS